jgi:hypothetical protein
MTVKKKDKLTPGDKKDPKKKSTPESQHRAAALRKLHKKHPKAKTDPKNPFDVG